MSESRSHMAMWRLWLTGVPASRPGQCKCPYRATMASDATNTTCVWPGATDLGLGAVYGRWCPTSPAPRRSAKRTENR